MEIFTWISSNIYKSGCLIIKSHNTCTFHTACHQRIRHNVVVLGCIQIENFVNIWSVDSTHIWKTVFISIIYVTFWSINWPKLFCIKYSNLHEVRKAMAMVEIYFTYLCIHEKIKEELSQHECQRRLKRRRKKGISFPLKQSPSNEVLQWTLLWNKIWNFDWFGWFGPVEQFMNLLYCL